MQSLGESASYPPPASPNHNPLADGFKFFRGNDLNSFSTVTDETFYERSSFSVELAPDKVKATVYGVYVCV